MNRRRKHDVFLTARWLDLALLSWEVDPGRLARHVPDGTELDFHAGRTFVSVVAFRFVDTRVLGLSIPLYRHFEEINLRFYVRYASSDGWRRGVVFVREVAPRRAVAWVANVFYGENYVVRPTASEVSADRVTYRWRDRGEWIGLRLDPAGDAVLPDADSTEGFIAEHYFGYVAHGPGRTTEYRVAHPPWRVRKATDVEITGDLPGFYGEPFADVLSGPPDSAFCAEGSEIAVHRGRRVLV